MNNTGLYTSADGRSLDEKIADAYAWIAAQPTRKTRDLHEFMAALGRVIDKGRALDVPVDFLNPLTDAMKRLSANIITKERA